MKDEFTTRMHAELLGDEIPLEDLLIMDTHVRVLKYDEDLAEACKSNGITVEFYKANIDRVMS